jgi:hypothetical protein
MPSSCRLSFEFFDQELLIPWNEWKDFMEKLREYERSASSFPDEFNIFKYLSTDKIIYTICLIGILKKLSNSAPSGLSFTMQYFSHYWDTLLIPNETDTISGWNFQDLEAILSSTSFLFHHLIPSVTHHLHRIFQLLCVPFMKRFPEVFLFPSPPYSSLSLQEDGYLSQASFCSLYSLVTSRAFSTNHPSDPSLSSPSHYSPLMFLPVVDYLNGTCEPNSENCSLELYQDEGDPTSEPPKDGISLIKGMYNVITTRDVLAGEELTIQYLCSQTIPLAGYLFTYGILPTQIQLSRFHLRQQAPSSEILTVHLHPAFKYLQSKLFPLTDSQVTAVLSSLSPQISVHEGFPVIHITSPLNTATRLLFSSLFSQLSALPLPPCGESDGQKTSQLLNCIAEILCSLPTKDNTDNHSLISPSQSLYNTFRSVYERWSLLREQRTSLRSYEFNQLRCSLILLLSEHQIRLEVLRSLRNSLTENFRNRDNPLSQFETQTGDLMKRVSEDLLMLHAEPSSLMRRDCCCWCGKFQEDEKKLFQCSRCKLVMYCRSLTPPPPTSVLLLPLTLLGAVLLAKSLIGKNINHPAANHNPPHLYLLCSLPPTPAPPLCLSLRHLCNWR